MRRAVFWGLFASTISVSVYLPVKRRSESREQALLRTLAILAPWPAGSSSSGASVRDS